MMGLGDIYSYLGFENKGCCDIGTAVAQTRARVDGDTSIILKNENTCEPKEPSDASNSAIDRWRPVHPPQPATSCGRINVQSRVHPVPLTVSCGLKLNSSRSILKVVATNLKSVMLLSPA